VCSDGFGEHVRFGDARVLAMITTTTPSFTTKIAVFVALVAGALLLSAPAISAAAITYQDESYAEFQQQLAGGQIQAVTINKRLGTLRTTLKDGRYVLAKYGRKGEPKAAAALAAKHVPVTVLTSAQAKKEIPKKAVHHKLRYIAGGVLIVVILLVGAVLFIRSRRELD
jgi:ATP-dependent Zn protease